MCKEAVIVEPLDWEPLCLFPSMEPFDNLTIQISNLMKASRPLSHLNLDLSS